MSAFAEEKTSELFPADHKKGKKSPFTDAYTAPDPTLYIGVQSMSYSPELPAIPEYCNVILDCASLYGNTSLACQFGWKFDRSCEFWKANVPLSGAQREESILGRKIKVIGLDVMPLALEYSKRMNLIDESIVQDFCTPMCEETKDALRAADTMVMQQCISYMPLPNFQEWMSIFLADRSRPKRLVYDRNPYYDKRDMSAKTILEGVPNFEFTEKFYTYRQKTEEEFAISQENGKDMMVYHYVVDFAAIAPPVAH
mmetsp:Transcript_32627/g.55009  ORF Transcript_32627/g.55009 Transcript_32627/m.55009 type:complete len:255 (-) Transcript_32627:714-1478(-)|eukprot:CAMPEP_0174977862 /NCGR_PEP_ID=MMETSP0004_2-20121128/13842_1 /TAXON_ID=420556 /ORGANISM="Ochromonas sp., Strain CCMP1393" /LENGTH=254 /DNA_ID=CAMNT_0016229087 /DNA_START=50 /DNA_END=814 /DNA_ORIENTATION=-